MYSRTVVLDDVDVLVDGVGRALVPLRLGDALAGRQDVEALVALGAEEVPAALQVADQRVRLVLGRDADAADAGIERVRQREIDDARLAAEIDGGLGAPVGQLLQAAAAPAGKHVGHGVARQRLNAFLDQSPCLCLSIFSESGDAIYRSTRTSSQSAKTTDLAQHDRRQRRQRDRRCNAVRPRSRPARARHCPCRLPPYHAGIGVEHLAPAALDAAAARDNCRAAPASSWR